MTFFTPARNAAIICLLAISAAGLLSVSAASHADVVEIYPGDSFKAAFESLTAGDTLIVHEGTYSESGSRIRISAQGTASQPIIVKGADGEARPLITRPASSTPQNTINIEGASYVTIQHLEITGNGDGINMNGGPHHITIEDNDIHDIDVGVNFRSSMDAIVVRRNHIYNTDGTGEGMYVGCNNATCAVSNSIIEQNWIHDTRGSQGDGIEIKYGSWGNIVRDNVIHDANYPCILAYGVTDENIDQPNLIEGNVVWNCGQGIDVIADAIVRNNIVIDTLETQSHVQVPIQRNVTIVNNTVIGSMPLRGWGGSSDVASLTVANNVVYGSGITNAPGPATYSANQEYATGTAGIFIDPDNWDFWPAVGSPLIEAADAAYAPVADFNNASRTTPYDAGAYESDGLAVNPGWPIQDGFKDVSADSESSPLVAAVLPASRSVVVGNPATAFATIINTGSQPASACSISMVDGDIGRFSYQATDSTTNATVGTANTPVDIPGIDGTQSFVFAINPDAPLDPVNVELIFDCENTMPAPTFPGLNTLLLSASSTPAADIVALAATQTMDGVVVLPGSSGANAFAVATVNVGAAAEVNASAEASDASLPLMLSICETDASGACLAPPDVSVALNITTNETSTFSVFVNSIDEIPFNPADNRIFVHFTDAVGLIRGSTSVAVRSESMASMGSE